MKTMPGQIDLFDVSGIPKVGEYVKDHGRKLCFDEMEEMEGQLIVYDRSTQSHQCYEVVRVVEIYHYPDGKRRLIYDDGTRQHGLVDERYFLPEYTGMYPSRAYALKEANA